MSRMMREVGHVACLRDMRSAYKIVIGKRDGWRLLGRRTRRCEGNIRMDLRDKGWEVVDWINLAQNRDQWRCLDCN